MNPDLGCSALKKTVPKDQSCHACCTFFLMHSKLGLKKVMCLVMMVKPNNQ